MNKLSKLAIQLVKFGGVGVLCFFIDYAVLHLLVEFANVNYLAASAIAFSVSVVVNYILSILFVFDVDKSKDSKKNFALFIIFSIIGLGLTELLMWVGVDVCRINYHFAKIGSTAIVMVFNFITRKMFLEK